MTHKISLYTLLFRLKKSLEQMHLGQIKQYSTIPGRFIVFRARGDHRTPCKKLSIKSLIVKNGSEN